MRHPLIVVAFALLAASPVLAGQVDVTVLDADGHPVADAVVSLSPQGGPARKAGKPVTRIVDQKKQTFLPYVTAMHPGDSVVFHDGDTIDHQVYSFSPIAHLEATVDPGESTKPLEVKEPGIAAFGCNIHDRMLAYLYVTQDPYIAVTDATGKAHIDGVEPGRYVAHAWHPQFDDPSRPLDLPATLVTERGVPPLTFHAGKLRPDPRKAMSHHMDS